MYKEMRNHIRRVERANSLLVKENRELKAKLKLYQRLVEELDTALACTLKLKDMNDMEV